MTQQQVELFCCEKILLGIVKMIKMNNLSESEIAEMNNKILKEIFEYNFMKYPRTEKKGKDIGLARLIIPKDDRKEPEYDLINKYKDKVVFRLKNDDENYNE